MPDHPNTPPDTETPTTDAALVTSAQTEASIERLARDPAIDVEKLARLIAMREREQERLAIAAFNESLVTLQAEIPEIPERGEIVGKGGILTTYALQEDIQKAVRPLLLKHGFALTFRTEWPDDKTVVVVGMLTHRDGHMRESRFQSAADTSGAKNAIQALGSAVSYGRRYTTCDLLNITSRGLDDDGARALDPQAPAKPPAPEHYDEWKLDMMSVADLGLQAFRDEWTKSNPEFRRYMSDYERRELDALKHRTDNADRARKTREGQS
jgi:ERF superfamily